MFKGGECEGIEHRGGGGFRGSGIRKDIESYDVFEVSEPGRSSK